MKIICMSDTHNRHHDIPVPEGDMLIHAGDFSVRGDGREALDFAHWFRNLPHKHKVVIAGNHDKFCEVSYTAFKEALGPDVHYLDNQGVIIEGQVIWGSPWTPTFSRGWAFNADRGAEIKRHWDNIPDDVNILITHGPAYGIRDWTYDQNGQKELVGCYDLLVRLRELKELKLHVFGHIHDAQGIDSGVYGLAVNASTTIASRTNGYVFRNLPIIVDINI